MAKFFFKSKDGGPDSNVTGYWLIESKRFFSVVLLRFDAGSREAFHDHAFNAWSLVLGGLLKEVSILTRYRTGEKVQVTNFLRPGMFVKTARERLHKVYGMDDHTWVLSLRGPWKPTWIEYFDKEDRTVTLTNGRKIIG